VRGTVTLGREATTACEAARGRRAHNKVLGRKGASRKHATSRTGDTGNGAAKKGMAYQDRKRIRVVLVPFSPGHVRAQ